jgi:hypothetical protein
MDQLQTIASEEKKADAAQVDAGSAQPEVSARDEKRMHREDALVAQHLLRSAELSYHLEETQRQSLSRTGARLMTCIPVLVMALILATCVVIWTVDSFISAIVMTVLFGIIGCVLAAAFIVLLYSIRYFKHSALASPMEMVEFVASSGGFDNSTEAAEQYCKTLQVPFVSLQWSNEKAAALLQTARILLTVAIGLAILSAIVLIVLLVLFG